MSSTLWAALSVTVGATITLIVEVLFAAFSAQDLMRDGVNERLRIVSGIPEGPFISLDARIKAKMAQYADIGTGQLRRFLARTEGGDEDYARKAVWIGLSGRLVDLCAGLLSSNTAISESDQEHLSETAGRIDQIREWGAVSARRGHMYIRRLRWLRRAQVLWKSSSQLFSS